MSPSHFLKIHFNIIRSTPRFSKWSLSVRFLYQKLCVHLSSSHICYVCRQSLSWFDQPSSILWVVQMVRLLIMEPASLPCYLVPLWLQYPPQHLSSLFGSNILLSTSRPFLAPISSSAPLVPLWLQYPPHHLSSPFGSNILLSTSRPSLAPLSSSAPYSRIPSAYVPPSMWATKFQTNTKQQAKL